MATVFSTKDPNPGVWFKFDDHDPESGEIRIRAANNARRIEIRKACVQRLVEYKDGQRHSFVETDEDLLSEMLWDYTIVEWTKLEDDDGSPLVCDKKTKAFLMQHNVGFALFVNHCLGKLTEEEETRVARLKKNLSTGSSGSKTSRPVIAASS